MGERDPSLSLGMTRQMGANKGRVGGSQRRTANSTPYSKKTGCHSEWSETERGISTGRTDFEKNVSFRLDQNLRRNLLIYYKLNY